MHEWALAEAILKTAEEVAQQQKLTQITEVVIRVGELQQVDSQILRFAISQMKHAPFEKAKFRILTAKTTLRCRVCGASWLFSRSKMDKETAEAIHFVPEVAHTYVKCPKCGSPDFEIASGRGVWLECLKGAK